MHPKRLLFAAVTAVLVLFGSVVPAALAQAQSLYWERYDVDIAVVNTGDLVVHETQVIDFTSGVFHEGYAQIPTKNTDGIDDIIVSENGQAYRLSPFLDSLIDGEYGIDTSTPGLIGVTWEMGYTEDQTRTFVLSYAVHGAIRRYPQGNEFQWNVISPGQHSYDILESTTTLHMPPGAPLGLADYLVPPEFQGVPMTVTMATDKLLATWVAKQTIAPNQGIQIVAQFAPNTIAGAAPSWQAGYDLQTAYTANVRPWLDLGLGALGLLILLGGPAALYLLWYLRGRAPQRVVVPEYITAPPQGLPPGIAGTLVDEKADVQDIIATLMDLARRGYLAIEETSQTSPMGLVTKDYTLRQTLEGKRLEDLTDFERQLYTAVFQNHATVAMRDLNQRFYTNIPGLQQALYNSCVKLGYFTGTPQAVRGRYGCFGGLLLVLSLVGGGLLAVVFSAYSTTLVCPFMAATLVGIILLWIGQHMPVESRKGAEARALSKAFRNYLTNLEKYAKPEQVTDQFEKYLPFAIAFGLERTWINRFSRIPATPTPAWYHPLGRPFIGVPLLPAAVGGAGPRPTPAAGLGGAAAAIPSLQGMSDGLSGGLQSMSDGLNTMLNSAARTLTSTPPASNTSTGGLSFSGGSSGGYHSSSGFHSSGSSFHSSGGSGGGGRGFH